MLGIVARYMELAMQEGLVGGAERFMLVCGKGVLVLGPLGRWRGDYLRVGWVRRGGFTYSARQV